MYVTYVHSHLYGSVQEKQPSFYEGWCGNLRNASLLFAEWLMYFCDLQLTLEWQPRQSEATKLWSTPFEMGVHVSSLEKGVRISWLSWLMVTWPVSSTQIYVLLVVMWQFVEGAEPEGKRQNLHSSSHLLIWFSSSLRWPSAHFWG